MQGSESTFVHTQIVQMPFTQMQIVDPISRRIVWKGIMHATGLGVHTASKVLVSSRVTRQCTQLSVHMSALILFVRLLSRGLLNAQGILKGFIPQRPVSARK